MTHPTKQECPMKGRHMSAMHRDACPVCNPNKTVPELNAAAGDHLTSNEQLLKWLRISARIRRDNDGDDSYAATQLDAAANEIERLHAALEQIRQQTQLLSDSTALMCGQMARNALAGYHPLTADGSPFETKAQPASIDDLIALGDNFILPIDVKIGAGTFRKGVKVGTMLRCLKNHAQYATATPFSEETKPDCVHNLIDCVSTLTVIDPYKAKCRICYEFFDLPLDGPQSSGNGTVKP